MAGKPSTVLHVSAFFALLCSPLMRILDRVLLFFTPVPGGRSVRRLALTPGRHVYTAEFHAKRRGSVA